MTAPLALIATTEAGAAGVALVYGIGDVLARRVLEYLVWMLPLPFVTAQRMFYSGLLVQAQRTWLGDGAERRLSRCYPRRAGGGASPSASNRSTRWWGRSYSLEHCTGG